MLVIKSKIIVILIAVAVTIVMSKNIGRYSAAGDELLENGGFEQGQKGWGKTEAGIATFNNKESGLKLTSKTGGQIASVKQQLDGVVREGIPVQLTASVKVEGVGRGEKVWESARIIFLGLDKKNKPMYHVPHALVMLNGTTGWKKYSKIFISYSDVARQQVEIQLVNVEGTVWVKGISLRPVAETMAYRVFWGAAVLMWAALAIWVLAPHLRAFLNTGHGVTVMLVLGAILAGVLAPVNLKHIAVSVAGAMNPWIGGESSFFRLGHFTIFMLLSIVVFRRIKASKDMVECVVLLALFSLVTETLQLLVDGRTFRVADVMIDIGGVVAGLMISRMLIQYGGSNVEYKKPETRID